MCVDDGGDDDNGHNNMTVCNIARVTSVALYIVNMVRVTIRVMYNVCCL